MPSCLSSLCCPVIPILLLSGQCLFCQTSDGLVVSGDPRPIEKLAELMEQRFHIPFTYEDPKWTETDLVLAPDPQWRITHPGRAHEFIPRSLALTENDLAMVPNSSEANDKIGQMNSLIGTAIARQGDYGARFTSIFDETYVHVVPRNGSPLDLTVDIDTKGFVTAFQALEMLCSMLTKASGSNVVIGTVPINYLNNHKISLNESTTTARQVLIDLLGNMYAEYPLRRPRPAISWKLLYAYDGNLYALNLDGVSPDPKTAASLPAAQTGKTDPNSSRAIRVTKPQPRAQQP